MARLFEAYRAFHEQGFVPIFTEDGFDSRVLVEACLLAGMKGIEYTLRRHDAPEMIPWIRKNFPDLFLLVGSTLDDERIVRKMRKKHPQIRTLAEVTLWGVDGFVSMLGWSVESIRKYSPTHVIAPSAMTVTEALQQTGAGAHFQKLLGPDVSLVKLCRNDASFDYCPILVTGGQNLERIPQTIDAGAVLVGAGFDLTLKGLPKDVGAQQVAGILRQYLAVTAEARARKFPQMTAAIGKDRQTWLDALPHYHTF